MSSRFGLQVTAVVGALAAACTPAPPRGDTAHETPPAVTIGLDRSSYAPGTRVELRLTNNTGEQLGYNACFRSLERQVGDSWTLIVERGRVCTMQLDVLEPRATRVDRTSLPPSLERGRYRLVLSFSRESAGAPAERIRATSGPFQVQ